MHLLHTVLHTFLMVLLERIYSNITTLISSLLIISFILMTCLFDQVVLLLGEIGCRSLLGLKGLTLGDKGNQISFWPNRYQWIAVLFINTRILKFKSQLTFAFFTVVNHISGSLRKQKFSQWVQKTRICDLWLVDFDPFCVFLCFKVCCLWS